MDATFEITCKTPGFWRAGRAWPATSIVGQGELTAEQWERIEAESELTVTPTAAQSPDASLAAISPTGKPPIETQAGSGRVDLERETWTREQMLIDGIRVMIAQQDPSLWVRSGAPKIAALREHMGDDSITAAERDAAWAAAQATV